MKKSIMKRWVAALRSGEYVQGKDQLVSDNDKFCCLGVLCNLSVDAGIGEWKRNRDTKGWCFVASKGRDPAVLPLAVKEWAGMKSLNGELGGFNSLVTLSALNDGGHTFSEIADVIEANWEAL